MMLLLGLFAVAALAGLIDAIAGGGGLLTVPALALAGFDPLTTLATNKLQSSFGSGSATLAFARAGHLDPRAAWPIAVLSAIGSFLVALTLTRIPRDFASVCLPFILLAVAGYFAVSPRIGDADVQHRMPRRLFLLTVVPVIGFYDGVFGPGTGSFFMIGFVGLLGLGLLRATARTKVANFASNLAALATLAFSGHIVWTAGFAMGLGQFLGARLGAGLTMRHGARLVKPVVVTICCVLAVKLALAPNHPIGQWVAAHWSS
jgi:uncharacterized membrane protein YfcA